MDNQFTHGYALLIGVGQTDYAKWSLPATVKDAQALKTIFTDPNLCAYPNDDQHTRLLHDTGATRSAILNGLSWLQARAVADPDATIVIFYAGHGWLDQSTNQYYLIQHDTDPVDTQGSALSASEFTTALRQIAARRLLAIFDCCHAEGMATARSGTTPLKLPRDIVPTAPPRSLVEDLKQGTGRAVFSASRGTQLSWERPDGSQGIYTYHLLEALQGAGNQPGDTVVHLSNVMNYVARKVPETVYTFYRKEQTPFFDTATEDFPIALLRGGRGLPAGGWHAVEAEASSTSGVRIGGTMTGGTIKTGNQQVEQRGKYNVNADRISGTAIGDNAQVLTVPKNDE